MLTSVLTDFDPVKLGRLVDRKSLFMFHWRFRRGGVDAGEWSRRVSVELEPMFAARLLAACAEGVFRPAAVVGIADTWSCGDGMTLASGGAGAPMTAIPLARRPDGRCLADILPRGTAGESTVDPVKTGWFVATLGPLVARHEAELRGAGRFEDYHLFHGMAAALAEALAEETHRRVEGMLGVESAEIGKGRTTRFSPGYPCCPDLAMQSLITGMLDAARIGVSVSETFQMIPELTVSAVVINHPDARNYL